MECSNQSRQPQWSRHLLQYPIQIPNAKISVHVPPWRDDRQEWACWRRWSFTGGGQGIQQLNWPPTSELSSLNGYCSIAAKAFFIVAQECSS